MRYYTYIFDFDYTLGDATEGIVQCFNYSLNAMGLGVLPKEQIVKTIGLTLAEAFTIVTKLNDEQLIKSFLSLFKAKADEIMLDNTQLFDDTIKTLGYLKSQNISIGIVTTKYRYRIEQIIEKFDMSSLIDVVIGFEDVKATKPDPEGLYVAIEKLKSQKNNVLYIGDNIVDAKAAFAAKIDFVAVTTGTTVAEEFAKYPNVAVVSKLSEIININKL